MHLAKIQIFISLTIISIKSLTQVNSYTNPDSILIGDKNLPQVLLVGTWHFHYPGLDAHQVSEENRVNIFSERRQIELQELVEYIALFKPTMICVEGGRNSGYIIRRYERWKSGENPLGANEIDQIAFRLMDRFDLDTLYGVDAYPLILELADSKDTSDTTVTYIDEILNRHYFGGEDEMAKKYTAFYEYRDQMKLEHTLLESFQYMNSEKVLDRGFGAYIAGGQFDSEYFEGPDALSMFWFNRNLRIFHNIRNIDYTPEDRILVLFGAGHISILNYFFECTPEFDMVKFDSLTDQ